MFVIPLGRSPLKVLFDSDKPVADPNDERKIPFVTIENDTVSQNSSINRVSYNSLKRAKRYELVSSSLSSNNEVCSEKVTP